MTININNLRRRTHDGQGKPTSITRADWSPFARFPVAVLVALLILGLVAGSAAAAGGASTMTATEAVTEGKATWQGELSYSDLKVQEVTRRSWDGTTEHYTRVCLYMESRRSADAATFLVEAGCGEVANGSLSATSLSSLTLAPVTLALEIRSCPTEGGAECESLGLREVTVSGDWAASGELRKFREAGKFDDGTCTYRLLAEGKQRASVAVVTVDGKPWGPSQQGHILRMDVTERSSCQSA